MNSELTQSAHAAPTTDRSPRERFLRPSYRVSENDDAFHVSITVPGVNKSGVELSLEDDTLTIVARRQEKTETAARYLSREIPHGDFRLALSLNVRIDEEHIRAEVSDGILHLTLPKAEEIKPRRIEVN